MLPKRVTRPSRHWARAQEGQTTRDNRRCHSTTVFAQGKPVGTVRAGIFHKRCRASIHMLRRPAGWALDIGSLDQAEAAGAHTVQIEDTETGRTYRASIRTIRESGVRIDRGYGEQLLLPLDRWTVRDGRQMSFFGEVA